MAMCKITVSGSLGRDSELKYTANEKAVLNFSIANNAGFGDKKTTQWFRCSMFGQKSEKLASYFLKGTKLLIHGDLTIREYEKKDGTKGFSPEIFVNDFEFMGGHRDEQSQASKDANDVFGGGGNDDDCPF